MFTKVGSLWINNVAGINNGLPFDPIRSFRKSVIKGGGGGIVLPSDLANLSAWYRGDAALYDVNDDMTTWPSSNGGTTYTASGVFPTNSTLAGQPAPDFPSGAGLSGPQTVEFHDGTEWHIFLVGQRDDAITSANASLWTNHRILGDTSGWWGIYFGNISGTDRIYGYCWDSGEKGALENAPAIGAPYLLEYWKVLGSNEIGIRVNDGNEVIATCGVQGGGSTFVCALGAGALGKVAEIIGCSSFVADNDERAGIRAYVADRYGIAV